MPAYQYRALTQVGEVVSGSITAPTAAEVGRRIEYLGLIPIEAVTEQSLAEVSRRADFALFSRPRAEDVTIFTCDLALLLRTGARINDALDLLAADVDIGRMRPTVGKVAAAILSGESFAESISHHPAVFPPIYLALARVGEASGTLAQILEAMGAERMRAEALRRRVVDALRYPAFLLFAAAAVLTFFLMVVLPQFANVFRDFNAKLDPALIAFLALSDFMRANLNALAAGLICAILLAWLALRRPSVRGALIDAASHLPLVRPVLSYRRTALFCRKRRDHAGQPAHSGRHHGRDGRLDRLEPGRRQGAPRRQIVRRAVGDAGVAADGGAHVAARRGVRAIARACRTHRGVL